MKPELTLLVWSVLLAFVQTLVSVNGAMGQVGLMPLFGNREGMPEIKGWGGRAARAHRNMLESLVLFTALVLVVAVTGKSNSMTVLGAQLFFWGRVAYAAIYVAGIGYLCTAAWTVSIIGLVLIFLQLV